ncbi:multidrug efflux pump subunit AcrA (membrane-fusion protein) [Limnobacter thiooxidans]|uniref:RND efflux pump membrane fusion protein barrel-sandwich domain-containing protein n=1 Tax=Limnobacter thiooxidans TaxID=131080 RepID=A0AA86IWY0_9BURK|nr:multidrug efflux pump subunit AcrA (membrane-fusion protein) [Limnobacter thiooxidans]BET24587.1 hypothetical protein RGQ30_00880 [Limnobacter thiooxidans]
MKLVISRSSVFTCALALLALNFSNNTTAWAGPGHDHGEEHDNAQAQATPDVAMGNSPRRLPTGEVFLPKPAQRQLNVRTTPAVLQAHAKVIELNGKVVVDPQTGGLVQTTAGGRFEAPPKGIPQMGQKVTKGELLGHVLASHGTLERSAQQGQLAQLKSQLNLAESRLQRVQQLQDTLPRKELDAANAEVQGLKGQVAALAGGIGAKEALRAPASGVVSSSQAISGKVFDAGALVFEVLDPSVVRIDATWASGGVPPGFSGATVVLGDQTIQLNYVGAAGAVRDQSLTLVFENRKLEQTRFFTGQLVKVFAALADQTEGVAIPSSAVVKNAANQTMVWVKTEPETFQPQVVVTEPLDGQRVLVKSGLTTYDRVVTQGATLINQVR